MIPLTFPLTDSLFNWHNTQEADVQRLHSELSVAATEPLFTSLLKWIYSCLGAFELRVQYYPISISCVLFSAPFQTVQTERCLQAVQ